MQVQENISLRKYNSFGIDAAARYFASFGSIAELEMLLDEKQYSGNPKLVLGGGSNILFTKDYDGIVLKNELSGIKKVNEDAEHIYLRAAAGEVWHQFVQYCISNNLGGVENLSLIPGNVGASPMQNIGAYGVEIKDVFHSLEAYHISERQLVHFGLADCGFGYRESVFKRKYKDQFVITAVTYRLKKHPVFNTSYGAIEQELVRMGVKELSVKAIADAVINIRSSKLPNPAETGNAGSFFKNPEIAASHYSELKQAFPNIAGYDLPNGYVKLAAGWLIEHSGPENSSLSWKGYREGDAGCHAKQALVLVNYGNATGTEIFSLSEKIIRSVQKKYNVLLEREVNII